MKSFFDRLRGRPHDMSAEEVAELLRKFRDGTASQSEWDYFCTGFHIADPRLESIRRATEELHGPVVEPYTSDRLNQLIARAEALSDRPQD
jgi:hypothetical protein